MSDLNQVSEDLKSFCNQQQHDSISLKDDESNINELIDQISSLLAQNSNELESKQLIETVDNDSEYEDVEEDAPDNKNVIHPIKKSERSKETLDDDNNTQSPAYIPRKGKFYEHDDRTLDEKDRSKHDNRLYRDSDAKWQHDLYIQDEKILKSRYPSHRQNLTYSENGYHRHIPYKNHTKLHKNQPNNFDTTTYHVDARIFHRRRNFTNGQYEQQSKELNNYIERKQESFDNKNYLQSRVQTVPNPKRYSNIRNNMLHPIERQKIYQDKRTINKVELNDWPQAPPPPTSSQLFYQQQNSQYIPINYSQRFQEKK